MTRWTLKRWVAVCLLGGVLGVVGCDGGLMDAFRGGSSPCSCEKKPAGPRVVARLVPKTASPNQPGPTTVAGCAATSPCEACAAGACQHGPRIVSASAAPWHCSMWVEPVGGPAPSAKPAPTPATLPDPASGIEQMSLKTASREPVPGRKGYADLSVEPWFDRAEDYTWLKGRVLYSGSTNTWRLHYASVDDTDPYGGTVTLTGGDKLKALKDGQAVRIEGRLLDRERREAESPYEVCSFEVLDRP